VLLMTAVAILTAKNASIRREAVAKDAALATARQAVDQMLKRVADDKLNNMPLGHPLRAELLQDALAFYEGFLGQGNDDASLREDIAEVLNSKGCIERELGRCDDACRSFERSIGLLQSIVADDPQPPAIREKLVAAEEALAYTWQIDPNASNAGEADRHFRQALQMYRDLERDWPERRQPVIHSLRHLADLAFKRDARAEAEQYWREAIKSGEEYLEQHPKNLDARSNLCWACADLSESILIPASDRAREAEPILKTGLHHAATMRGLDSRSTQAREVAAFMTVALAHCYCRTERSDQAIELYRQGISDMESLCAEFPWNRPYWDLSGYLRRATVRNLIAVDRLEDAKNILRNTVAWFQSVQRQLPDDPVPQSGWRDCGSGLVGLLKRTGQSEDVKAVQNLLATSPPQKAQAADAPQ
jgi:tetratricopeptide (TPR) repeat protein